MGPGDGRRPVGGAQSGVQPHLFVPGGGIVRRLGATPKLLGVLAFVAVVAATPRHAWQVFVSAGGVMLVVAGAARLGPRTMLARLSPVVPFLALGALTPLVSGGARSSVDLGWFSVSVSPDGAWAGAAIAAKALLGGAATSMLAATTPIPDIVRSLTRLRVPAVMVAIFAFMLRYLDVLAGELGRMRRAMVARCHDPRWLWQVRPVAASVGTLFVRSYERGERVHQAMLARGFTGTMPDAHDVPSGDPPAAALAFVPAAATAIALAAWTLA